MAQDRAAFAIKTEIGDPNAARLIFEACRTMYGGKRIAAGDRLFLFASERTGGRGLFARGTVTAAAAVPRTAAARQTPRVSITVDRDPGGCAPLGRAELRGRCAQPGDGPEAELDFKLYRQATDKIVGLTAAADFLERRFAG